MGAYYDEVEIEDMTWDAAASRWSYSCPCGDRFYLTLADALAGEDVARCPGCSLLLRVVYDADDIEARAARIAAGGGSGSGGSAAVTAAA